MEKKPQLFKLDFHWAYLANSTKMQCFTIVGTYQCVLCYIGHINSLHLPGEFFEKMRKIQKNPFQKRQKRTEQI